MTCPIAFDGHDDRAWEPKYEEDIGSWIRGNLDGAYRLKKLMVNQKHIKDITLEFANGESVDFTLDDTVDFTLDQTGVWQTIELEGIGKEIVTDYVHFVIKSINQAHPDLNQLKLFGYAPGMAFNGIVMKYNHSGNFMITMTLNISYNTII